MLEKILADAPRDINALLWMTEVVDTIDERRDYLKRVLEIDPNNPGARRGLELLGTTVEQPPWVIQASRTTQQSQTITSISIERREATAPKLQQIILVILGIGVIGVLVLVAVMLLSGRSASPVQIPATLKPSPTRPATWTPTAKPRSTTTPRRPTATPVNQQCFDFADWLDDTRANLRAAQDLGNKLNRVDWYNPNVDEMIDLSNDYLALSLKQSQVHTTSYTKDLNDDLAESLDLFSVALWDAGLAYASDSQRLLDMATQNLAEALALIKSVDDRINSMSASCGIQ
jgi:hypothetical protein